MKLAGLADKGDFRLSVLVKGPWIVMDIYIGNVDGRCDRSFPEPMQMMRIVYKNDLIECLLPRVCQHFLQWILAVVRVPYQQQLVALNGRKVLGPAILKSIGEYECQFRFLVGWQGGNQHADIVPPAHGIDAPYSSPLDAVGIARTNDDLPLRRLQRRHVVR